MAPQKGKLITELRAFELKSELEKRGLDSQGVKVVLSVRLNKALRDEGLDPTTHLFHPTKTAKKATKPEMVEKTGESELCTFQMECTLHDEHKGDNDKKRNILVDENEEAKKGEEEAPKEPEVVRIETPDIDDSGLKIVEEKEEEQKEEEQKEEPEDVTKDESQNEEEDEAKNINEEADGEDEFEEDENNEEDDEDVEEEEDEEEDPEEENEEHDEPAVENEELLEDPLDEEPLDASPSDEKKSETKSEPTKQPSNAFLFDEEAKKTSIWIRGMTPATKASSVKQLASEFGKVMQSKIFNSKPINGEIRNCFAFVTFSDAAAMEAAIVALHRKEHDGRVLRVEKVSESQLTGSAERIAKEKQQETITTTTTTTMTTTPEEEKKKPARAVIQAPEGVSPRKTRQVIQAPERERKSHREVIRAPEKEPEDDKEKARRDRKPIVYKMSPGRPVREEREHEDTRRTISAAAPSTRRPRVTPPPQSSKARSRNEPSLIISARVDTRGASIKRSVERSVPSSITTSQLRRNPVHGAPPRASYHTQKYSETTGRGDHRSSSSSSSRAAGDRRETSSHHRDSRSDRDREKAREREMLEMLRRKDEEHRLREEKLEMQREREKMRFEAEKLERTKLELELTKQKLALQQAALAVESGGKYRSRDSRARPETAGSTRRRPAEDVLSPPRSSKVHVEDRTSRGRRESGGRQQHSSSIPSARHVANAYGIQTSLMNMGSTSSKGYEQRGSSYRSGGNGYESSNVTDFHSFPADSLTSRFQDTGYQSQSQIWGGLDANGQMTMETTWTGGPSASSSTASDIRGNQWQQYSGGNSSRQQHRDYGYNSRNNY